MAVVFLVLTLLAVAVIGLVAVGGVTAKLAQQPPRPLFDLEEAVEYVAERLPFEATAQLSYDDVRDVVGWHLDYLQEKGAARTIEDAGGRSRPDEGDDALDAPDEQLADASDPAQLAAADGADGDPVVAEDDEGVAFVLGRAHDAGLEVDDVIVVQVIEAEMAYLEAIGALGDPVDGPA